MFPQNEQATGVIAMKVTQHHFFDSRQIYAQMQYVVEYRVPLETCVK